MREMRVAFESSWLFRSALLIGVLRYADYTDISERSVGSGIKYFLFAALLATLVATALSSKVWRIGWNAPTIFLVFTVVASVPLLVQLGQGDAASSYSSAFCSSILYSIAAFYDLSGKAINFDTLLRRLVAWLLLLGLMDIGELLLRIGVPSFFPHEVGGTNQLKSVAVLIAIYLTTLSGKGKPTALLFAVLVAFLALRPTSTVVFCLAACLPIVFLIRSAWYKLAEIACYVVLLALALSPFLIYSFDDLSNFVKDIEGFVKADALGGASNTQVRLEILRLAFARWQDSSFLIGEMFTGGTTVFLGQWWLSFTETGLIPIHSDYLIILVEGGLVGYVAFNLALALIIRSHFSWLQRQWQRKGKLSAQASMVALAIPISISLAIVCSANPYLQYYGTLFVVWFVLFCSEICKYAGVRRSRANWTGSGAESPR